MWRFNSINCLVKVFMRFNEYVVSVCRWKWSARNSVPRRRRSWLNSLMSSRPNSSTWEWLRSPVVLHPSCPRCKLNIKTIITSNVIVCVPMMHSMLFFYFAAVLFAKQLPVYTLLCTRRPRRICENSTEAKSSSHWTSGPRRPDPSEKPCRRVMLVARHWRNCERSLSTQ